jgi:hypothetical protein
MVFYSLYLEKMKAKTLLKGLFGMSSLLLIWIFSFAVFANANVQDYQSIREKSREDYLKQLDQRLKKEAPTQQSIFNKFFWFLSRSSVWETQYFNILWWDNRQEFKFYRVDHLFRGNTFVISNDSSSDDDINFIVYELNSDWSRGSKVGGWYNDIKPGRSMTVSFLDHYSRSRDFLVIIENDGFRFQDNKRVTWSVQALSY